LPLDFHKRFNSTAAFHPAAGTAATADGVVIDTAGFGAVEFVISYGVWTTTGATFVPVVMESTATGSGFTSAAAGDLLGTEAAAGIAGAATVNTNVSKRVGYRGSKRYCRLSLVMNTATGFVSASAIRGFLRKSPPAAS